MKKSLLLLIIMLVLCVCAKSAEKLMVIKPNANLRAKPTLNSEVVSQVQQNETLDIKSVQEEWIEVVPPTNVDFYIFSDYVKDGVVECGQKLNIRAGPGINFSIVGQLENGDKVTVRGTISEWCRIAPPKNSSLWIHRSLVELIEPMPQTKDNAKVASEEPLFSTNVASKINLSNKPQEKEGVIAKTTPYKEVSKEDKKTSSSENMMAKAKETKSASPISEQNTNTNIVSEKVEGKTQEQVKEDNQKVKEKVEMPQSFQKDIIAVAPQKSVMPPEIIQRDISTAGLDLVPTTRQGESVEVEGVLRRKQYLFRSPTGFRLITYDKEGNPQTICYLKGNSVQLEALLNREMKIYGKQFWIKKQKYPVVIPERIILK